MNWVFDAETNDGRCGICNKKHHLNHTLIVKSPETTVELAICERCAERRVANLFSNKVTGHIQTAHQMVHPEMAALVERD